jgi:hypothetical protein
MVMLKIKGADEAASRGSAHAGMPASRSCPRVIVGDLHASIRAHRGTVVVEGDVRGCIISLRRDTPPSTEDIRVHGGEELIVRGTVHGDIQTEDSIVLVKGDVLGYVSSSLSQDEGITVGGNVGKPSRYFVSPRSVARMGQLEEAIRTHLREREGKVTVRPLLSSSELECNYGTYTITCDGRTFRKMVPGSGSTEPSIQEIRRFQSDVRRAARTDISIADFVNSNPGVLES